LIKKERIFEVTLRTLHERGMLIPLKRSHPAKALASSEGTIDFPTPPLPLLKAINRFIVRLGFFSGKMPKRDSLRQISIDSFEHMLIILQM